MRKHDKKYNTLELKEKKEVILSLERGDHYQYIMKKYNISKATVFRIKRFKNVILSAISNANIRSKRKTLHTAKLLILDEHLYKWFIGKRQTGVPISGSMIITQAKLLHKQLKLTYDARFSNGWLRNFKKRHGIRQLVLSGERLSADADGALSFQSKFLEITSKYNLHCDQIYNADKTGLYYRCLPTRTLAGNNEKSVTSFKVNKDRLTVLTCANAMGQHKTNLLVIGKSRRPRALKHVRVLPATYKGQRNAWMTRDLFKEWFFAEFVPAVKDNLAKLGKPENTKCLLLIDNCPAHPNDEELVSECGNIFTCFFPPNVTSLIQPMDQGVIRNLKCIYKSNFLLQMLSDDTEPTEFQKQFSIKDCIMALAQAWDNVKSSTLVNAWHKLFRNCVDDGKNTAHEQMNDAVTLLANNSSIETDNIEHIRKWINEETTEEVREPSNDESIQCITNPEGFTSSSSNSNDSDTAEAPSATEVEKSMATVLKYLEKTPGFSKEDHTLAYKLQRRIALKKLQNQELRNLKTSLKTAMNDIIE